MQAQIRPYIRERWRADLFQSPLIALSNSLSLSFACAHCPLSFSPLCICWSLCTVQKRALFVLVLAGKQKQRDGYGWEWPDSASVSGLCPNTETLLSCPSVLREEPPFFLLCCYAAGCWLEYPPDLSKTWVCRYKSFEFFQFDWFLIHIQIISVHVSICLNHRSAVTKVGGTSFTCIFLV